MENSVVGTQACQQIGRPSLYLFKVYRDVQGVSFRCAKGKPIAHNNTEQSRSTAKLDAALAS
jgi:hypothetical protein